MVSYSEYKMIGIISSFPDPNRAQKFIKVSLTPQLSNQNILFKTTCNFSTLSCWQTNRQIHRNQIN